jgi:hypothetical protein
MLLMRPQVLDAPWKYYQGVTDLTVACNQMKTDMQIYGLYSFD